MPRRHYASIALSALALVLLTLWITHNGQPIRVVDGDTVDKWPFRYRLVGFDAPEIRRAACYVERERGHFAAVRLAELIRDAQRVELVRTQWRPDRYGRALARLEVDGRDVATIAIDEGWGRSYSGRGQRGGWCE